MEIKDTYLSIAERSRGLYKSLGSRFIAFAIPVEREEQIRDEIQSLRREYHDARHVCVAWRLGYDGARWRASDDGEPSGSAGRQILGRIDSEGLSDVLVAVVRYFGGVKLGIPGLIEAYRSATADALAAAPKCEKIASVPYRLRFDYAAMPPVMKLLKEMDLRQLNPEFSEACRLETAVRLSRVEAFEKAVGGIPSCILEKLV